jgi:ABC-2 type transport system ATP-binding protein
VNRPDIVFLDEPTAGLDPQSRRELRELISATRREGRTILLTTHDLDEAERLCDRVAILDAGVMVAVGRPAELVDVHVPRGTLEDVFLRLTRRNVEHRQ